MISKQKEVFNDLVDERLEEINKLDKNVNPESLIYRYNGPAADAKFDEFDNASSLLDKIREDKVSLTNAKDDQTNLNQI